MLHRFLKRTLDITVALVCLVMASPLMVLIALLVLLHGGLPILFRQKRPGFKCKLFTLYKFRTMVDRVDEAGNPLPDAERLTPFGRFLRSTSLDELPELWNVLKGDMSLVGPRPLLMDYLPLYDAHQARRHEARPGITGWVQVNGRNALGWKERFDMDVWYVDNQSLWLDLRILGRTIPQVFRRKGIHHEGEATMTRFTGGEE